MMSPGNILLQPVRVRFDSKPLADIAGTTHAQVLGTGRDAGVKSGARIAIAAGSRGIANLAVIVRATVEALKELGAAPFIVPAMGSHGGATAEGQREVLASYGVTAEAMGCEIRSSMEVVELPASGLAHPLYLDRNAAAADGIVLVNRVKPHTDFHGPYESGLVKMAVIGLGKEAQATAIHHYGTRGLRELIPQAARQLFATGKILFGVGVVEDAYDQTALVEAVPVARIFEREPELLKLAFANMPRLPVEDLDVLLVDRIGKNISGTGMDTNIIGRIGIHGETEPASPRIKAILVSDLTEETHGNAIGIGLADVTTERLVRKMDPRATHVNMAVSGFLQRGRIPPVAPTDAEALRLALRGIVCLDPAAARLIRIHDTLHLGDILASPAVVQELRGRADITVTGDPAPAFDAEGNLAPFNAARG
jgi:hypothetical protein